MDKDLLDRYVKLKMDGADIIHGELKTLMVDCEEKLASHDQDDPWYTEGDSLYIEGMLAAYGQIYKLTYDIAFAQNDVDLSALTDTI